MPKAYELPSPGTTFDAQLWKLGALCKRKHDWANGQSLRHVKFNYCAFCRATPEFKTKRSSTIAEKRKLFGRESRSKYGLPYTPKEEEAVYAMRASIRRAGRLPTVADLVERQQFKHWSLNAADKRHCLNPWRTQASQYRYITDQAYRLYHRQKSKHYKAANRGSTAELISGQALLDRWAQFDFCCAYCGSKERRNAELEIEHVIPISQGGPHLLANIVPACTPCNSSKRTQHLETWLKQQTFFDQARFEKIKRLTQA